MWDDKAFKRPKNKYKYSSNNIMGTRFLRSNRRNIIVLVIVFCVAVILFVDFTPFKSSGATYLVGGNKLYDKSPNTVAEEKKLYDEYPKRNVDFFKSSGSCSEPLDPFHKSMMAIMTDFGKHECNHPKELKIKVKSRSKLDVSGYNINYISSQEIVKKGESYEFMEKEYIIKPQFQDPVLKRGISGALRNSASKRCIVPVDDYKNKKNPEQIALQYSSDCLRKDASFNFTENGVIRNEVTKMCFGLRKEDQVLKNDAFLVLTKDCNLKFDVVHEGVLVTSGFCLHPLGGGNMPYEGQRLCYYKECKNEARLSFSIFDGKKEELGLVKKEVELKKELNFLEIGTTDDQKFKGFSLSVQRKKLENVKPSSTSRPSIYVVALDETSANHFKRKLKLSSKYLNEEMKGVEYKIHAPITDSTRDNLLYTLTGLEFASLNTTKKSLFSTCRDQNYVSMFSSDIVYDNFIELEADHNAMPLYHAMKRNYDVFANQYCVISQPVYDLTLNYLSSFIESYQSEAKFAAVLLSEITLKNYNILGYMDENFSTFLKSIHKQPNTILIMTSIKGSLSGKLARLPQGVKEYKRPLLNIYTSSDLKDKYQFDEGRRSQITSPYDVFATVHELLTGKPVKNKYGLSLLSSSTKRDCLSAGVTKSMCPCEL